MNKLRLINIILTVVISLPLVPLTAYPDTDNSNFVSLLILEPRETSLRQVYTWEKTREIYHDRYEKLFVLRFSPGMITPLGKFGKMYNSGYGGTLSLSAKKIFFRKFEIGISPGFYYMHGNELIDSKNRDYKTLSFAPIYLTSGYNIVLNKNFCIRPVLSFGGAYLDAKYINRNEIYTKGETQHLHTFEHSLKGGLYAEYRYNKIYSISTGCEYGTVIEKNNNLKFINYNAGIGYSF